MGERIKHSGPDAEFCVLCLSGEHDRVEENPYGHVAAHIVDQVAQRRQDIAHESSGGANPSWDQLQPQDQHALRDEAQEWLRAAFETGEIQLVEQPATKRGVPRKEP